MFFKWLHAGGKFRLYFLSVIGAVYLTLYMLIMFDKSPYNFEAHAVICLVILGVVNGMLGFNPLAASVSIYVLLQAYFILETNLFVWVFILFKEYVFYFFIPLIANGVVYFFLVSIYAARSGK